MPLTQLNRNLLRDKTLGSLHGVFIGDALGLPIETMGPIEIRDTFGYVDSFIQNKNHKWKNIAKRSAGTWSDDTQLTLALMDSITRSTGYNPDDIKKSHIEAMDGKWGEPLGWGGSTREAVKKMKEGQFPTCSVDGAGNGTCMKIAPLAIYCVYKTMQTPHGRFTNSFNASLLKKCRELTMMTHGNPLCIVAAYCQSRMVIRAMQDELPKTNRGISRLFVEDAAYAEDRLQGLVEWHDEKRLSHRLDAVLHGYIDEDGYQVDTMGQMTGIVSRHICSEKSSYVYNSYPLVAYCVAKYAPYRNFRYAMLETVNAGADADSNGAMVGAILGAAFGFHGIPSDMVRGVNHHRELMISVRKFEQSL